MNHNIDSKSNILLGKIQEPIKRILSGIIYILIMWFGTKYSEITCRTLFIILAIVSLYEMSRLRKGKNKFLSFTYIIIPFVIIQLLITNNNEFNPYLILFIFILTWTFDTFAYIFGVLFGHNKIMPSISPKKSWEGFLGGFSFTLIIAFLCYQYFGFNNSKLVLIISIILPFTATLGDFIESYYKREAKVKDSGNFIPGHGGLLDRIDALMITIPTVYIITTILNKNINTL